MDLVGWKFRSKPIWQIHFKGCFPRKPYVAFFGRQSGYEFPVYFWRWRVGGKQVWYVSSLLRDTTLTNAQPQGFLNDMWKLIVNIDCPFGSHQKGFRCEKCFPGTFSSNGTCVTCPPGTFSDVASMEFCQTCLKGTYQPVSGKEKCLDCPTNAECSATEFSCHAGYTINAEKTNCTACLAGFWKPLKGNQECSICPKTTKYCRGAECFLSDGRQCTDNSTSTDYLFFIYGLSMFFIAIWSFAFGFVPGFLGYISFLMPLGSEMEQSDLNQDQFSQSKNTNSASIGATETMITLAEPSTMGN